MDKEFDLQGNLRLVRALIWVVLGLMYFLLNLVAGVASWGNAQIYLLVAFWGFVFGAGVQYVTIRAWPQTGWKRFAYVCAAVVAASALQSLVDTPSERLAKEYSVYIEAWRSDFRAALRESLFASARYFVLIIWMHAFFAAYIWTVLRAQELVEKERRLAAAESLAQKALLSALRAQVNPHFLFNALNAISALISSNRNAEAEEALLRLSEFFRASLSAERRQMVSVADELEMLDAYLDMEQIRFPDRLNVSINMEEESSGALMPSFLLQPLVENAIKYAVAPATGPVHVAIAALKEGEQLVLTVEDNGNTDPATHSSGEGVGLENVSNRINALYGETADMQITKGSPGFRVAIRIPFSDMPAPEAVL